MNSLIFKGKFCRMCLKHNAKFNWNDEVIDCCGVTFKDCYYKYTQLEEIGPDCYPTNLCGKCVKGVKNAHNLFEKALESYVFLQNAIRTKDLDEKDYKENNSSEEISQTLTFDENNSIECLEDKEAYIEADEVTPFPPEDVYTIKNESADRYSDIELPRATSTDSENLLPLLDAKLELGPILETSKSANVRKVFKRRRNESLNTKSKRTVKITRKTARVHNHKEETESLNDPLSNTNIEEKNATTPAVLLKMQKSRKRNKNSKTSKISYSIIETNLAENDTTSLVPFTSGLFRRELRKSKTNALDEEECSNEPPQNSSFSEEYSKDSAQNTVEKKEFKRYMCQYCSFKTHDIRGILEHEATHLENRERNIICSVCGTKFYSQQTLKCHMETHKENRTRKHQCEFCEKAFFNKGGLNVHRRIHLGLMVKCQVCEKEFYRQIDLDRHLVRQHSSSNLRNVEEKKEYIVQCQYCDKSVLTNRLKGHMAMHLNQPQAKCKICEKEFFTRTKCTEHLRRFHKISNNDYADFVQDYVKFGSRTCHLKTKQEREVKLVTSSALDTK